MQSKQSKILFTGGHMTPALAVLSELQSRGYQNFVWVGHKYNQAGASDTSPEYKTVAEKLGVKFIDLRSGKLVRSWHRSPADLYLAIVNLVRIPWGFLKAGYIVLSQRPSVIASFGGYLAIPIVFWARLFGIKILMHEQTVLTGVSNSLIGKLADIICISWETSKQYYPAHKTVFTGNPLRPEIFTTNSNRFRFSNNLPVIYITPGNQGSLLINKAVWEILPQLLEVANVVHQTGSAIETVTELAKLQIPQDKPGRYLHQPYVYADEVGEIFAKADLVIARGGANTVTELLALGKLSITIPIPWVTKNEQTLNAKVLADTGLGYLLPQSELTSSKLLDLINKAIEHLTNQQGWKAQPLAQAQHTAQLLVRRNAAALITDKLEVLIQNR
jgi:UDP-N-acetylglucosamine--N-acetylmuramyl-(pentapeptide) pyrophosphoryl-undecaprenol N-acetylglucosamine transferase